jgi:hypothetical protein
MGSRYIVGLFEYFQLWDTLQAVQLTDEADNHAWKFTSSGIFSSKSAYRALFNGSSLLSPGAASGNPGPLVNARCSYG